jgi:hypothetical protein
VSEASQGTSVTARGASFARLARAALEKHLPGAMGPRVHWHLGANEAWVGLPGPDGLFEYFGLRRHLDWVTGEVGISRAPSGLAVLPLVHTPPPRSATGFRIRLGDLLDEEDRWWPAGDSEAQVSERLEELALQLAVKGGACLRRWGGADA